MSSGNSIKRVSSSTDYQLHDELGCKGNVIDFTLQKLKRKIASISALKQKILLEAMLEDYISGVVAISWRRGLPSALRVTKDK